MGEPAEIRDHAGQGGVDDAGIEGGEHHGEQRAREDDAAIGGGAAGWVG